jgi:hypothetical protein
VVVLGDAWAACVPNSRGILRAPWPWVAAVADSILFLVYLIIYYSDSRRLTIIGILVLSM